MTGTFRRVRTLVVLPTYEEAPNVAEVLRRIRAEVPDADILVVDDNSPDGTAALAKTASDDLGQVDVLVRPAKEGLGTAYRHGFREAFARNYDVLVQMDADLSHDPAAIPSLLAALEQGADMVIGSRYIRGGSIPDWPWIRRALSRYGNWYACSVLGMKVHDTTSGFRALRVDALESIDVFTTRAKGYGFQIETAYRMWRHRGAISEVPIVFADRVRGRSKLSFGIIAEELTLVTWWGIRDRFLSKLRRRRR